MKNNKKAFTLVELVVIIIILVILWSISVVSYNSYLAWVRDSSRIAQLSGIQTWLNAYSVKNNLPLPEDSVNVEHNSTLLSYQWNIWQLVLDTIDFKKWWKDPKEWLYFTYYLTKNRKYFQLASFLEEEKNLYVLSTFPKANAEDIDYSFRFISTFWDKLGVLTQDVTNLPIQLVDSIISDWKLDIWTTTDDYRATFYDEVYITWDNSVLSSLTWVLAVWWNLCTFSWSNISCPSQ